MASIGLIAKAVENLQSLQIQDFSDQDAKKKEKIANCMVLTNGITLPAVKAAPQVLNLSIGTLLCLCDDSDSDVRTVADECLNKIIRAVADSHVLKVQFELYREIKRNGAARCLKAALWRFSLLSHMIRPVKAKVFAVQLTPCILEIVKRKEGVVIETLSQSLPLILKTLGHYIPDKDVQNLLRAFFQNVSSSEAAFRRASANMILNTCLHCRKPQQFINNVIEQLIDMLSRVVEGDSEEDKDQRKEEHLNTIYGVLTCLRLLIPCIDADSKFYQDFNEDHILDHYICIYELCLFYAKFYTNHNVVNAALETLAQLLQNPPKNVVAALASKDGITHRVNKLKERGRQWPSRISLSTTAISEDNLESSMNLLESDIMDTSDVAPKVEKWMTDLPEMPVVHKTPSKGDMLSDSSQIIQTKDLEDYSGLVIGSVDGEEMEVESNASSDVGKFEKPIDISLPPYPDAKEDEDLLDETTYSIMSSHDASINQFFIQRDLDVGNLFDNDITLEYCCRLLTSSFLLTGTPGQLVPDRLFRVSVKSLALTCIGNVLKLHPDIFFASLTKNPRKDDEVQMITDILLLANHTDPQIRGNLSMAIGYLLQGTFARGKDFHKERVTLENLISLILKGLEDESATACRQTLTALGLFLPHLLESEDSQHAILILKTLPSLEKNPYFLVKIKLAEILSELSYTTIEHSCGELKFQDNVLCVLLKLLSDTDQRVRRAAGSAITRIIPYLYYECPNESAVTRKASLYTEQYLAASIGSDSHSPSRNIEHKLLISSLVKPYDALLSQKAASDDRKNSRERVDAALSLLLKALSDSLMVYSSKYSTYGCCEALSMLSETYLTTTYSNAWDCLMPVDRSAAKKSAKEPVGRADAADSVPGFSNEPLTPISISLFSQTLAMLSSSPLSLDLATHRHLLLLAGNLASGIACGNVNKPKDSTKNGETGGDFKYWTFFKDKRNSRSMERLLVHVMRVLNIFQHVVEDLPSPIQPPKSSLPSLPSPQSLSPKRKLLPDTSSKSSSSKSSASDKSSSSSSSSSDHHHHRAIFRFGGKDQLGSLSNHPHYLRLYEILRAAHANYRVTLDQGASELYLGLLNATLQVLSQLLEMAVLTESGRIAEEILHYLQSTVLLSSTMTVQCVRQLLKSLFSTNLIARWCEVQSQDNKREQDCTEDSSVKVETAMECGFYEQCFQRPAKLMAERIKGIGSNCRGGNEPDAAGQRLATSQNRKDERKLSSIMKILNRSSDQSSVSSFIRLFEPLVIKSLIQYTISNSVPLQCQVLMLLSQLVQLHINYCLMDSDKIFIGFVMKQFEFIEEGHIFHTDALLPRIFDFLVRLSYEKYHSKLIIGVPKIIQLCDGLMASGQPPPTHCIPALVPVVEEMFQARSAAATVNEEKELETTREVLISMMLRLAEYPRIVELMAKCLVESRASHDGNGEEKWRRWSRQMMDTVLPLLSARKMRLEARNAHFSLLKLFSAVSPTVFRPVDPLLKVLFTVPPTVAGKHCSPSRYNACCGKSMLEFKRWISTVNAVMISLVSYAREEAMLARLADVVASTTDLAEILLMPIRANSGDPLNVSGTLEPFTMPPERILSRFIFRVISSMSSTLVDVFQYKNPKVLALNSSLNEDEDAYYIIHQFSLLLQLCVHMFETGSHCKVANASMQLVQGESDESGLPLRELNEAMIRVGASCPSLACQWVYLLTLLGYDDMEFWSGVIGSEDERSSTNSEILRRASTILLCDFVCENASIESDRLDWLLHRHVRSLIALADEPPVRELVSVAVHRDPQASGLFLDAVVEEFDGLSGRPAFVKRLLKCLEAAHQSQSGKLLLVLVPRLLRSKYLALSRMAAKIASRRVEVLLALGRDEAMLQIRRDDFKSLMDAMSRERLDRKHGALVGLLNKLATSHYDLEPLQLDHSLPFKPEDIKKIQLGRSWFLSQVKYRCCNPSTSYGCFESAWLMSHLNPDECTEIFSARDFNVKLLHECAIVGARLTDQAAKESESDGILKSRDYPESTLFTATKQAIMERLRRILKKLPPTHGIFTPGQPQSNSYTAELTSLLNGEPSFLDSIFSLITPVTTYIASLTKLDKTVEASHEDDLARFAVLCLEFSHHLVTAATNPRELELTLSCARTILRDPQANRALGSSQRYAWVCSAAAALTSVTGHLCEGGAATVDEDCSGLRDAWRGDDTRQYAVACLRMAALVGWLEKRQRMDGGDMPSFYWEPLRSLIIAVARQPLVNSFVLAPPLLWSHGCPVVGSGPTKCSFVLCLSEPNYIPELDVLEEFISRVSLLGWISRQQFEEIWMVLLGVLNVSQLRNDSDAEIIANLSHTASLAVQAITNLLMQTLILPCPGNPDNGRVIHHSRDPQLSLQKKSTRRLFYAQDLLLWKHENSHHASDVPALENIFNRGNLEPRSLDPRCHSHGQLSVSYLWSQCSLHEDKLSSSTIALKARRDEALAAAALDVNSCLHFLMELYASWLSPGVKLHARLLNEVVKSLLFVSELFVERSQFQWMLDSCLELCKSHPVEDEVLRRHLVVAVCKASAALTPLDPDALEKVKRLIDSCLKCGSLSIRISTIHGILYLLQSSVLASCEDTMAAIHPLAVDYIQRYIDLQDSSRVSSQSEEHQCVLWVLVFFLLEHAEDSPPDVEAPAIIELVLTLLCSGNVSTSLHRMLLQGLERLVATKSVIGKVCEQVVKISIERLRQTNPALSLPAFQLFLTCMYTDTADRFNQPDGLGEPLPDVEPEILVRSIERSNAIFDKIKRGYPMEVDMLCAVLSEVLIDFFPPQDIFTRVIGEFLSPQQPHPRLLSGIVFKVCERADEEQLKLLKSWVVFSARNLIESLPLIMSTWCLSCFFISTSTDPWLRALFPHVQSRIGKYECEDKKILCLAASEFYSQLTSDSKPDPKDMFIKTFEEAAKHPGTPFAEILASL